MSIGKFAAGTTLATPAIGGVSYVTYEQLTKEETTSEERSTTQDGAGPKATETEGGSAELTTPTTKPQDGSQVPAGTDPDGQLAGRDSSAISPNLQNPAATSGTTGPIVS